MIAHFVLDVADQPASARFYAAALGLAPRLDHPGAAHARALAAGACELSALAPRDWGHLVAYSVDPDGHVLASMR